MGYLVLYSIQIASIENTFLSYWPDAEEKSVTDAEDSAATANMNDRSFTTHE
jgi:hypothetical protein